MNIQNATNAANTPNANQQNPLQAANEQNRPLQQEQNAVQNAGNQVDNRDTYTRSQEAERLQNLTNRRQELEQQLGALDQNQTVNTNQPGNNREPEIRQEINQINRELTTMTREEPDAATRRQREAMTQYSEQNQAIIRAKTTTREVMNLFGE